MTNKLLVFIFIFLPLLSHADEQPSAPGTTPPPTEGTPATMNDAPPPSENTRDMSGNPETTRPDTSLQPKNENEWKPSAEKGEPIFDWSKYKDATEVPHPFSEKGLIRVGKDDVYYYRVEESKQTRAISFTAGTFELNQLKNPDESGAFSTFNENYNQTGTPAIMISKEWQLWHGALGKAGIQAGSGLFVAQGHGHFAGTINAGLTPLETFTFVALPNNFGVVYRMQFKHRQLFVPYGLGGLTAITFAELRDDNVGPKFGIAAAAYAGAGLAINMNYYNYLSRVQLDREYGINGVYLTLEYRQLVALSRYNFTTDYINGGFLFEY